jgi:NAD(P)-dependent dehydrogenase (short-subunit alcohol dehydrogenase family)
MVGSVAVVTGGGSGIGRALCRALAARGNAVAVLDLDFPAAAEVAGELGGGSFAAGTDVTDPEALDRALSLVEQRLGPIDCYASNAGVARGAGLGQDSDWQASWEVHVLAHVYAARRVLPAMLSRGRGFFLITASAAGLLTNLDSAPYTASKHAAVGLAEWLAISYAGSGVRFGCLCPQGVNTPMTRGEGESSATRAAGAMLEPDVVAAAALAAAAGHFLVLPHPEVAEYERRRADDRDRWLAGMARARARNTGERTVREL